jgi:5'-deoxynucleotidase YfbR-like HD superfamily hydrolase
LWAKSEYGPYINLWNGDKFYPKRPDLLRVNPGLIAHALSRINRYGGQLDVDLYSVAQHSCLVEELATKKFIKAVGERHPNLKIFRLQALFHDCEEFVTGDIPKPIKECFPEIKQWGDTVRHHIFDHFGIPREIHQIIKEVDYKLMVPEVASLSYGWDLVEFFGFGYSQEYIDIGINYWPPGKAKMKFLERYNEISKS